MKGFFEFLKKASALLLFPLFILIFWKYPARMESAIKSGSAESIENYDIRLDGSKEASNLLGSFRERAANARIPGKKDFSKGEDRLRKIIPSLKIAYSESLQAPEIISPDIAGGSRDFLTSPSRNSRKNILRGFIKENSTLFGLSDAEIEGLKLSADYTNPDGNLSFIRLEQERNGLPIFQGEISAGFNKKNQIIRIINNLAPGIADVAAPENFSSPGEALVNAAKYINIDAGPGDTEIISSDKSGSKFTLSKGQFDNNSTLWKTYFPLEAGLIRPAWSAIIWDKIAAYYLIIDAEDGSLFWRKNITQHQTQPATYNVYGNTASLMKTADSPTPFTPGCSSPLDCIEPPPSARMNFTLIGNEPPYTFNNLGWIPDGENRTIGNNVEAGIDRDLINGVDPNGWAFGSPNRVFEYSYNPAPGDPAPGEEPLPATQTYPPSQYQQGSITHAFYVTNRFHDEMYRFGFTEQARNSQEDNFGRGGVAGDRYILEIQDIAFTNAVNSTNTPDGIRGRLQLTIWTDPTTAPNRDSALDSQIILHETTHNLSNRLHGNGGGLSGNMGGMMGEGWSDFYAIALLSEAGDAPCGVYPVAGYGLEGPGFLPAPHYHGIRRFPMARLCATGPNGLPHNPLTFRYLNTGCDTLIGTPTTNPNSAFPRNPGLATSGNCAQINNGGEVWSAALWEVRGKLIDIHGAIEGNRRAIQYITDGMKLSPLNPNMLQGRDAIIAAAIASNPADADTLWRGFAARGMGANAIVSSPTSVIESFDLPNVTQTPNFTFTDNAPGGNGNSYPEPGETLILTIPLTNNTGATITGVTLNVNGVTSAFYGDIQNATTVTQQVSYRIPQGSPCPGAHALNFNINSSQGAFTVNRSVFLGVPTGGGPLIFTNPANITINDGTGAAPAPATPYPSSLTVSGIQNGSWKISLILNGLSHTFPGDMDLMLVSPSGQALSVVSDIGGGGDINNINLTLSDTAANLLPSNQITEGIFKPTDSLLGDIFPAPAPAAWQSPAPAGSATLTSTFGSPNVNGEWKLYAVDDAAGDTGSISGGWSLKIESNNFTCGVCVCITDARADFDGDGKSDISVFRPSEGNWYIERSNLGFTGFHWGTLGDNPVPGDYDGDNKTDFAVFRPSSAPGEADFYVLNSSTLTLSAASWGIPGDAPIIEDYDGDNKDDFAVYRASARSWYILRSSNGALQSFTRDFASLPLAGDFDGDGRGDYVLFTAGGWSSVNSNTNYSVGTFISWGQQGDIPAPADYDGDGKDDMAVFRPSQGIWYIRKSTGGSQAIQFGQAGDILVPGDYDGDGKADQGVFRNGNWYINRSATGFLGMQFGLSGDIPIPNRYISN